MQEHGLAKISAVEKSAAIKSTSLSKPKNPTAMVKVTSTSSRVEPQTIKRVEAGKVLKRKAKKNLIAGEETWRMVLHQK
jgi:hypothetical protein